MSSAGGRPATPSQTVGPFFHIGMIRDPRLGIVEPATDAARIRLAITVTDGDGRPVPDALVEIWQSAAGSRDAGLDRDAAVCAFGRLGTSLDGCCEFDIVHPMHVAGVRADGQAPHINVCLFARGLLRQIYTRVYFPDTPGLEADPVLALVADERRRTLCACEDRNRPGHWQFRVRLQGPDETVFFDV